MDLEIVKDKISSYLDSMGAEYQAETLSEDNMQYLSLSTYITFTLNKIQILYYFTFLVSEKGYLGIDVHIDGDKCFLSRNSKNDKLLFEFNEKSNMLTAYISSNNSVNKEVFYLHFEGIINGETEVLEAIKTGFDELCGEELMQLEWLVYKRCE